MSSSFQEIGVKKKLFFLRTHIEINDGTLKSFRNRRFQAFQFELQKFYSISTFKYKYVLLNKIECAQKIAQLMQTMDENNSETMECVRIVPNNGISKHCGNGICGKLQRIVADYVIYHCTIH